MRILIVDDNIEKIGKFVELAQSTVKYIVVDSANNCLSGLKLIKENKYDLLVSDILLPIRDNEDPTPKGGSFLISEIASKLKENVPNYIIGLTQYKEFENNFSNIWKVFIYSPSELLWENQIKQYLIHILNTKSNQASKNNRVKPAIFFEGLTDLNIFREAFEIFLPGKLEKIELKSESNAGAAWVSRQIIIWANSLNKDVAGKLIKSVGLVDLDQAGKEAIEEINRVIKSDTEKAKCFKMFKYSATYAKEMQSLYQKGIKIPVTLEELFLPNQWKYAKEMGWLEMRSNIDSFLEDPKMWDKFNIPLKDFLKSLNLSANDEIYLSKVRDFKKEDFSKHIIKSLIPEKTLMLSNFKSLVQDISQYLEI